MRTLYGRLCIAIVATVILAKVGLAQHGSSTGGSPAGTISSELRSAGQAAELAYNSGLRAVKRAKGYDGQALKASTPEKAAKSHERAQEAYRESISAFVNAVIAQPTMYKSWYYIGLADRHLGNYDEALSAYAKVLELNPHHPDAIENRGEVFLALNQIEEAQSAYMDLFRESRPLANELMSAMRRWIESRRQDTQGIAPAEIEGLAKWVDERAAIAAETVSLRPEH
jgi:tetratricopeptide (TPR) repeat protein